MRRVIVLGAIITCGALSYAVSAYQQPPAGAAGGQQAPRVVEVDKLKDNLFVLRGGGGNTAVFVMADGITVVDTKNPGWGQPILDKIKELSPKPIVRIMNTHTHGDHVSGNVEFPTTVDIVVHENTAANMKKMAPVTGLGKPGAPPAPNIFTQNNGKGLPKQTFKDRLTIGKGPDQIDLYYFGRGHTNGDAWILFPALRVVHAGDIFARKGLLFMDGTNGGSGLEVPDTLAKAAEAFSNIEGIITGHSTVMSVADLREFAEFNREFVNSIRDAKRAGRTVDEIEAAWKLPEKYNGYDPVRTRLRGNIELIFKELQ
jgi:cyclase